MPRTAVWVVVGAALAVAALATVSWIRVLNRIAREEADPAERRKWRRRVFFLRGLGAAWYENHRRRSDSDRGPTAD